MSGITEGRLELMTGIKERRFWPMDFRASEASALAGEAVLKETRFARSEMDLLVHAAVCRDRLEPATASYVHAALGLDGGTQIFDLSNACLGFLNAMVVAGSMIESGQIERASFVRGKWMTPMEHTVAELQSRNKRARHQTVFCKFDDWSGAVAAVLCRADLAPGRPQLRASAVATDTSHSGLCEGTVRECPCDADGIRGIIGGWNEWQNRLAAFCEVTAGMPIPRIE